MAGHSRSKNGVASLAYVPAIHLFLLDDAKTWMPVTSAGMTDCEAVGSAISGGLQIIVRLDDLAQLVLGAAVAAVGVGMVEHHQLLEARLDLAALGVGLEAERMQRL